MQIIVGSHVCRFSERPTPDVEERIREATKFEPKDGNTKKGYWTWENGKRVFKKRSPYRYLYNKAKMSFPTGLLATIRKIVPNAELVDNRPIIGVEHHGLAMLRPYQHALVDHLVQHDRSAGEIPTGTGKTLVSSALALSYYRSGPVLITVPAKKLLRQTYETLKALAPEGVKVGKWGESVCEIEGVDIVVATIQSIALSLPESEKDAEARKKAGLAKAKKKNEKLKQEAEARAKATGQPVEFKPVEYTFRPRVVDPRKLAFLESVVVWIMDETHGAGADSYVDISKYMPNARRRHGITATWRREDGKELLMEGMVGPLVYRYTPAEAIEDGWLARPNIKIFHYRNHIDRHPKPKYDEDFLREVIYQNQDRNRFTESLIQEYAAAGHTPCLVLVESLEHGDELSRLTGIPFVDGQRTSSKDLDDIIAKLASNEIPILLGSEIFNVGVDIPQIRAVGLVSGTGMSATTVIQQVGRGTRLHPPTGKTSVEVFVIADKEPCYLEKHGNEKRFTLKSVYPGCVTDVQVPLNWQKSPA